MMCLWHVCVGQVRVFNLRTVRHMRDLDPENIDQLVALRGL